MATTASAGATTIAQRRLDATRARIEADRAELQAQANVLQVIATAFQSCRSGTQQLLGYVLADDYVTASAVMDAVFIRCTTADDRLEAYHSTYGR